MRPPKRRRRRVRQIVRAENALDPLNKYTYVCWFLSESAPLLSKVPR